MKICNSYEFIAGHWLPRVPPDHKCSRHHGHNYKVDVVIEAGTLLKTGMILDFFDLDKVVTPLLNDLDHRDLNNIEGLENPTAEIIAEWFRDKVAQHLPMRYKVSCKVWETPSCWAECSSVPGNQDYKETATC